jgi:hypothetical protein
MSSMIRSRLQVLPTTLARFFAQDRFRGGEDDRLDAAHPFAPAQSGRQVLEFAVDFAANSSRSAPSLEPAERRASGQVADRAERCEPFQQSSRSALGDAAIGVAAASESTSNSACSAALAPFARGFGAASASFVARRPRSAEGSQARAAAHRLSGITADRDDGGGSAAWRGHM